MRKLLVLAVLVTLMSVAMAQPFEENKAINETNFEETKSKILQALDERIDKLLEFKEKVEKANNSEELNKVLEEQKLEIAKIRAMNEINATIKRLEKVDESIKETISELESMKDRIDNASNVESVKETMKDVKEVLVNLTNELGIYKPKRPFLKP